MSYRKIETAALVVCALFFSSLPALGQTGTKTSASGSGRVGEVTTNDVYVRSGPSLNHYTIMKLNAGDRVAVVGEEADWYEVLPPDGAFSLISGEFVDALPDGARGIVNGNRVRVRAGSQLNDSKYTVQTMLDKGAEVIILGSNPDGFLRIHPPDGTTLWISGDLVTLVPDGRLALERSPTGQDSPGDLTSAAESSETSAESGAVEPVITPGGSPEGPSTAVGSDRSSPEQAVPSAFAGTSLTPARRRLEAIDADTRAEMAKPMAERRLEPLMERYATVADDKSDELASRYAAERARQLRDVQSIIETIREMRRLSEQTDSARREFLQERASIPTVIPPAPRGLDAEGTLRESALYPPDRKPRRCRLVDERNASPRTIAYVDFPAGFAQPINEFMGRLVGLRAASKTWQEGSVEPVPVYEASELVLIEQPDSSYAPDNEIKVSVEPDGAGNGE